MWWFGATSLPNLSVTPGLAALSHACPVSKAMQN